MTPESQIQIAKCLVPALVQAWCHLVPHSCKDLDLADLNRKFALVPAWCQLGATWCHLVPPCCRDLDLVVLNRKIACCRPWCKLGASLVPLGATSLRGEVPEVVEAPFCQRSSLSTSWPVLSSSVYKLASTFEFAP